MLACHFNAATRSIAFPLPRNRNEANRGNARGPSFIVAAGGVYGVNIWVTLNVYPVFLCSLYNFLTFNIVTRFFKYKSLLYLVIPRHLISKAFIPNGRLKYTLRAKSLGVYFQQSSWKASNDYTTRQGMKRDGW